MSSWNWLNIKKKLQKQNGKITLFLELNSDFISKVINYYIKHKINSFI